MRQSYFQDAAALAALIAAIGSIAIWTNLLSAV